VWDSPPIVVIALDCGESMTARRVNFDLASRIQFSKNSGDGRDKDGMSASATEFTADQHFQGSTILAL
jgi:hypothetical protein